MSRRALLAAACQLLGAWSFVQASTTTLDMSLLSPPGSITTGDSIKVRARTPMDVFPTSGYSTTTSLSINGSSIDWYINSYPPFPWIGGGGGVVLQVLTPMGAVTNFGPFASGDYQLTAHWAHQGGGLLAGAPSSGTGVLNFTVDSLTPLQHDGDYDGDGDVDGADLLVWQGSLGTTGGSPPGDGDRNGVVNDADLAVWQADLQASSGPTVAAVPEPTATAMAVLFAAVAIRGGYGANSRRPGFAR